MEGGAVANCRVDSGASFWVSMAWTCCRVLGLSLRPKWRLAQEQATSKSCCQSSKRSCFRIWTSLAIVSL